MRISHKVDYATRAMTALARAAGEAPGKPTTSVELAAGLDIPHGSLDDVLRLLRGGGLVRTIRGGGGGWLLARPADQVTVADVIRVVDGPLASVRGVRPHELAAIGEPETLIDLWIAVRTALRRVLEKVTIADLAAGSLPADVRELIDEAAWETRPLRA